MTRKALTLSPAAIEAAQAAALLAKEVRNQLTTNGFRDLDSTLDGKSTLGQMSAALAASILANHTETGSSMLSVVNIAR